MIKITHVTRQSYTNLHERANTCKFEIEWELMEMSWNWYQMIQLNTL